MKGNSSPTHALQPVDLHILQITQLATARTHAMPINDNWIGLLNLQLGNHGAEITRRDDAQHEHVHFGLKSNRPQGTYSYVREQYDYMRPQPRHVLYISLPHVSWAHHLLVYVTTTLDWEYKSPEEVRDAATAVLHSWLLVQEGDRTITTAMIEDIETTLVFITKFIDELIVDMDRQFYASHYNNRLAQLVIEYTDGPAHDSAS